MQDLKELAQILSSSNSKGSKLVFEKGSKLAAFFEGLSSGKIETDEDALWHLYQQKEETSTYRKLKTSLRNQLLDSLCHQNLDSVDYTDYQKAYFECHKQWAVVKILSGQNANIVAISQAAKLLKQTIKYDFVHLSMDIASYLRLQYALRESNDKKFLEANRLFAYYRDVHDAECFAEELYALYMVQLSNARGPIKGCTMKAKYEQLVPLLSTFDSYRLHLYGRLIGLRCYDSEGDSEATLAECEDTIRFFLAKPYEARGALQIFYYEKINCHFQLRQIVEGRKAAHDIQRYLKPGTFNWFKAQELFVNLSMHTAEYQSAADTIFKVVKHARYQFLPENVKEIWRLYEAYLYFLSFLNRVTKPLKYNFKVSKFLNETPILAKDKSGTNVAIKVIQILVMIAERKYTLLLEASESLEQYCYRYLKTSATQRSFLFMKMLLQIPMGHFDRDEVEKRTRKYLNKLSQLSAQEDSKNEEIEIVPYEHLWPMVMTLLVK